MTPSPQALEHYFLQLPSLLRQGGNKVDNAPLTKEYLKLVVSETLSQLLQNYPHFAKFDTLQSLARRTYILDQHYAEADQRPAITNQQVGAYTATIYRGVHNAPHSFGIAPRTIPDRKPPPRPSAAIHHRSDTSDTAVETDASRDSSGYDGQTDSSDDAPVYYDDETDGSQDFSDSDQQADASSGTPDPSDPTPAAAVDHNYTDFSLRYDPPMPPTHANDAEIDNTPLDAPAVPQSLPGNPRKRRRGSLEASENDAQSDQPVATRLRPRAQIAPRVAWQHQSPKDSPTPHPSGRLRSSVAPKAPGARGRPKDSPTDAITDPVLNCPFDNCPKSKEIFRCDRTLRVHITDRHRSETAAVRISCPLPGCASQTAMGWRFILRHLTVYHDMHRVSTRSLVLKWDREQNHKPLVLERKKKQNQKPLVSGPRQERNHQPTAVSRAGRVGYKCPFAIRHGSMHLGVCGTVSPSNCRAKRHLREMHGIMQSTKPAEYEEIATLIDKHFG